MLVKGLYHGLKEFVDDEYYMNLIGLSTGLAGKTFVIQVWPSFLEQVMLPIDGVDVFILYYLIMHSILLTKIYTKHQDNLKYI